MLYHLSTFIQAVCTRSLTSFALFTATLKHSCSLSSTRGDPPWREKKTTVLWRILPQPPSLQWLKLLLNIVLAYKMVAVVVVAIELCWRVKVFFLPAPRLSDHQSTCYLVYELLQFYHHLWWLLSQFQSLDFPLHLLDQQTILCYRGKKKSMFAGFHNKVKT